VIAIITGKINWKQRSKIGKKEARNRNITYDH